MFKSARWKSEKNKIKCVFKLQFHATQLTQSEGDSLLISVVPADVGKATSRLEKSKVQDGNCYWEKPLYETVKFSHDTKTGKIHEKIYYFIVAKDSSRFGGVGEVSIDFASYVEATKLFSLSLPLKSANFAAILHVSVQRVQGSFDREIDRSESANNHDRSFMRHFSNGSFEGSIRSNPTEDQMASNESDINFSRSSSNSTLNTPQKQEPKKIKQTRESSIKEDKSLQWDWLNGSNPKLSTDDSSTSTLGETSEESSSDVIIQKLKAEVVALTRQNDVSELELQTLRKQIMKEIKKGNELSREVAQLKEERNVYQNRTEEVKVKVKDDPWALLDELQKELNHEKELTSNLRLQLEKTQESSTDMVLPLEKSKSKSKSETDDEDDDEAQRVLEEIVKNHSGIKETYLLEQKIIDLYGEIELYKRDKDELEMQMEQIALDYEILKQENHDMSCKLEQSQLQEQLKMQYECSSPYTSVNELESQIDHLDNELKTKSKELLKSILTIKELETHVKNLEEDLENQALGFEADMEDLMRAKVEQEQRAIRSEENLRKVKLQNANTAGKLQEEFRRLSTEMASAFKENENAAMKAMDEAYQLQVEKRHLEEMLKEVQEELQYIRDQYEDKLFDLSNQINLKSKQLKDMEVQIGNLQDERKNLEDEVHMVKMEVESLRNELSEVRNVKKDKENEVERLQSEIERLKSRCNEMKQFVKEYELEKGNLMKKVSQLNNDLKKKDETISSIEKKLKDCNSNTKTTPRNNKPVPASRGPKEITNMKDNIKLLEGQIKLKETALELSEASFLEKEKDLQQKIQELERRLEVLDQDIISDDAIKSEINKTGNQEIFETLSNRNKLMEVELKEMQERYSEISLKFAEVEGERQQLVMTLRNLKNAKKC